MSVKVAFLAAFSNLPWGPALCHCAVKFFSALAFLLAASLCMTGLIWSLTQIASPNGL